MNKDYEEKIPATVMDIIYEAFDKKGDPAGAAFALGQLTVMLTQTQQKLSATTELMNARQDYTDIIRRRLELANAITDHVSEDALSSQQLERIAEIVWPSLSASDTPLDPTQIPTPSSELQRAASLLWQAHWIMRRAIGITGCSGSPMVREVARWNDAFNQWRESTGMEVFETEEMKKNPF